MTEEYLSGERPTDIRLNGETYAITLCTPGAERELVLGLLYSDGHIDSARDILSWEQGVQKGSNPVGDIPWVEVTTSKKIAVQRRGALNSACGACGKTAWEDPPAPIIGHDPSGEAESDANEGLPPFFGDHLSECFKAMNTSQSHFIRTGGCHAAGAFSRAGNLLIVREDVGRHNAVDKAIGFLLAANQLGAHAELPAPDRPYLLCVSGRIAYEIVAKAYRAGFKILAAVGAPTSLAVQYAEAFGMTLLGFCREDRATAYTHFENITASNLV